MKIGNIRLKNKLFLAPMVDVTDCAYRLLCREYGAAMAYTEMIYVDAILHENVRTLKLLKVAGKGDRPIGLQVTGNNIDEFTKFSKLKLLDNYDLIDINCGCPSTRIVGNEAGSYLLKSPDKIASFISVLKDKGLVVTAKIRLGFKNNNVLEVSKAIEKAGADLLTVHARTAQQKYTDAPDWDWISKVKKNIGIPVVGNGGIINGKTASEILDICDGAMVASAAIGNPFVFREILRYLKTGKEKEVEKKEKVSGFSDYLDLANKHDVLEMSRVKYIGSKFLKGFDGASSARESLMKIKDVKDIKEMLKMLV